MFVRTSASVVSLLLAYFNLPAKVVPAGNAGQPKIRRDCRKLRLRERTLSRRTIKRPENTVSGDSEVTRDRYSSSSRRVSCASRGENRHESAAEPVTNLRRGSLRDREKCAVLRQGHGKAASAAALSIVFPGAKCVSECIALCNPSFTQSPDLPAALSAACTWKYITNSAIATFPVGRTVNRPISQLSH